MSFVVICVHFISEEDDRTSSITDFHNENGLTQRTSLLQEEDIRELNNNSEHVHTIESLEAKLASATDEIQKLEEKIKEYTTWNEKLTRDCTSISLLIFCCCALNDVGSDIKNDACEEEVLLYISDEKLDQQLKQSEARFVPPPPPPPPPPPVVLRPLLKYV